MNDDEMDQILHADNPSIAFTRLWTRKEAVLKLIGTGITDDIKTSLPGFAGHLETIEREHYVYSIAL